MKFRNRLTVIVAALIWLLPKEGHTSYHSSVSKKYPGVVFSMGYSDFGDQPGAPPLKQIEQSAKKSLNESAPAALKVYQHFATGEHDYTRLRPLLDTKHIQSDTEPAPDDYSQRGFAIQFISEYGVVDGWVYLRDKASESVRQKLAYDFGLSQIDGGVYAKPKNEPGESPRYIGEMIGMLTPVLTLGVDFTLNNLGINAASIRDHRARLEQLAQWKTTPLPDGGPDPSEAVSPEDRAHGQVLAQLWLAALDKKPCPPETLEAMASWPADVRDRALRLAVLLLADPAWKTGVANIQAHLAKHPLPDKAFSDWLAPLLKTVQ
jgi:hypothetical protein